MPSLIANSQPSLVITQFMAMQGIFPSEGGGGGLMTLGMVRWFGGDFDPGADLAVNGQVLPISGNEALYAILGTTYGGDGVETFALPDFGGRATVSFGTGPGLAPHALGEVYGAGQVSLSQANLPTASGGQGVALDNSQETAATGYYIRTSGYFQGDPGTTPLAAIVQFAGNFAPSGYIRCEGQLLPIAQNQALFALLGTTYGGNGQTNFALPDLRGRAPIGTGDYISLGERSGSASIFPTLANMPTNMGGQGIPLQNHQPTLALNYLVALEGYFPSRDSGTAPEDAHYVGEIILFAGTQIPEGWARCEGQLLSIAQNTALFSLFGTQYGGNGQTTFALPDFRGRVAVGSDDDANLFVGDTFGADLITLTSADMPPLNITGDGAANALYGGDANDVISGGGGNDSLVGNGGADNLQGGSGADQIDGGDGDDSLNGGGDDDSLDGGAGDDTLLGAAGNDMLFGRTGNDSINGGDGNDRQFGAQGDDTLNGGSGDDTLNGGLGADVLIGGAGIDTATYATSSAGVTVGLTSGNGTGGDAQGDTLSTIENLIGSDFNDQLSGDLNANLLQGALGNDVLRGGGGDDRLVGGGGSDSLFGGTGADIFVFRGASGADVINDFAAGAGAGDVISLDASIFTDFADVRAHAANDGMGNVVISKGGMSIKLIGVIRGDLNADDFVFELGAPRTGRAKDQPPSVALDDDLAPLVLPAGLDAKADADPSPVVCPPEDTVEPQSLGAASDTRIWEGRQDARDFAWII